MTAAALLFITVCTATELLPITSLVIAVAICAALCGGRAQKVRREATDPRLTVTARAGPGLDVMLAFAQP